MDNHIVFAEEWWNEIYKGIIYWISF
jgi:hypothetical protein